METCWDDDFVSTNMHEVEAIINKASNTRLSQSPNGKRIKTLQLPSQRDGPRNPLPLLFLKSNLLDLETCEIPWFRPDADLEEIEQVVRERCPNLKHLTCPFFFGLSELAEAMRAFIRGCSGIQSFKSEAFNDGYDLAPMLILSELVSHHHATLETLELTNAFELRSSDLQEILSCCTQLKRFWVICDKRDHILSGLAFQDISRSDWVCTELRELGITLNRCRLGRNISGELQEDEKQNDPRVWLAASATRRAYQQIGRLEKLEVLAIDSARGLGTIAKAKDYMWDLTLSRGWLSEMAGLTSLRTLELRVDFLSMMGQAEVEFMYDHWPELTEILFPREIEHIHAEPHWQWLLYNLPQLSLMPESAAHTFFAIPELVVSLSTFVPLPDLTRCMLVCKEWSRQFQPQLWSVIVFDYPFNKLLKLDPSPTKEALTRNLRSIRTVDIIYANDAMLHLLIQGLPCAVRDSDEHNLCTDLRRIYFQDFAKQCLDPLSWQLGILLDHSPYLTHLEVPSDFLEYDAVQVAISKLWHLQFLKIRCLRAPFREHYAFLQCCLALPELTELIFVDGADWDDGLQNNTTIIQLLESIISKATTTRLSRNCNAKTIKSLQFPSNTAGVWNRLPFLLLKSSLVDLETCEIPFFSPDADGGEIEQLVREHCPNLRHLRCPVLLDETHEGQSVRAFIRGCSGLQSFAAEDFEDGPYRAPWLVLTELVSRHHTTLEDFALTGNSKASSRELQEVLSRCKQLKRFWVICDKRDHILPGLAFQDISRSDWVCTGLRELGLILNRCRRGWGASDQLGEEEMQVDPLVWLAASTTKRVYQQIGRLEKLEVLALDIDKSFDTKAEANDYAWDLTLSKGWLREMAGLKNLKRLELKANFWSLMGQTEVEFMHEQWPLLREISLPYNDTYIHALPHWQWLLRMRPQLCLVGMKW
ncbi:unnamed protein product [Mortierella alpina]